MSEYADLLACYRSGQIPEAAWQEHLKDEGLRAYVEAQRVEVRLDPKALEAATADVHFAADDADARALAEAAVRAYLSAAVPADVAGMVERLSGEASAFDRGTEETDAGTSKLIREAATALTSMSAKLAAVKHVNAGFHDEVQFMRSAAMESRHRAEEAEAALAEARKALEPFASMGELLKVETEGFSDTDEFDLMFGDHLFHRFTAGDFFAARRAHKGGEDV